jgi:hypothetical protein
MGILIVNYNFCVLSAHNGAYIRGQKGFENLIENNSEV